MCSLTGIKKVIGMEGRLLKWLDTSDAVRNAEFRLRRPEMAS